jgi:hypothetical protein
MSITETTEKRFEQDIESYLINEGGYIKGGQATYDKSKAIDLFLLRTDMPPFFGPVLMLVNSIYSSASLSAS